VKVDEEEGHHGTYCTDVTHFDLKREDTPTVEEFGNNVDEDSEPKDGVLNHDSPECTLEGRQDLKARVIGLSQETAPCLFELIEPLPCFLRVRILEEVSDASSGGKRGRRRI